MKHIKFPNPACRYADDSHKAYTREQVESILNSVGFKTEFIETETEDFLEVIVKNETAQIQ